MKLSHWAMLLLLIAIAASAGYMGYRYGRGEPGATPDNKEATPGKADPESKPAKGEEGEPEATAKVKVAPARMATMGKQVVAYGTVIAAPEQTANVSVPFESRVRHVLVMPGQSVAAGTALVEVEPSPETTLQLQEARSNRDAAAKDLAQVKQRVEMKLATNQDLLTSQQAMRLADLRLENLEKRDITTRRLTADVAGLVSKVDVQEGQIIPAGGPLVELVAGNRIEVKLNVEPGDVTALKSGQAVHLAPVHGQPAGGVEGQIRLITRRVNPASRLVDVFVSLPPQSGLMLEAYVRGQITVDAHQALVVPRSAVLPEEDKHVLYTIHDDKAVKHEVQVGLSDDQQVELLDKPIKPGEPVVVEGNYELEDGMAVEVETAEEKAAEKAETSATAPATASAASEPAPSEPASAPSAPPASSTAAPAAHPADAEDGQ